jgi:hypothetical protein
LANALIQSTSIRDPQEICIAKRNFQCVPFRDAVLHCGPVAAREGKAGVEIAGTVTLYRTKNITQNISRKTQHRLKPGSKSVIRFAATPAVAR